MNLKKFKSEVYKSIHFLKAYSIRILKSLVLQPIYRVGHVATISWLHWSPVSGYMSAIIVPLTVHMLALPVQRSIHDVSHCHKGANLSSIILLPVLFKITEVIPQ